MLKKVIAVLAASTVLFVSTAFAEQPNRYEPTAADNALLDRLEDRVDLIARNDVEKLKRIFERVENALRNTPSGTRLYFILDALSEIIEEALEGDDIEDLLEDLFNDEDRDDVRPSETIDLFLKNGRIEGFDDGRDAVNGAVTVCVEGTQSIQQHLDRVVSLHDMFRFVLYSRDGTAKTLSSANGRITLEDGFAGGSLLSTVNRCRVIGFEFLVADDLSDLKKVAIKVDPYNKVEEEKETNNTQYVYFESSINDVRPSGTIDLVLDDLEFDGFSEGSGKLKVEVDVCVRGSQSMRGHLALDIDFTTDYFKFVLYSRDGTSKTVSNHLVSFRSDRDHLSHIPAMRNHCKIVELELGIADDLSDLNKLVAKIDPYNKIEETDEGNNTTYLYFDNPPQEPIPSDQDNVNDSYLSNGALDDLFESTHFSGDLGSPIVWFMYMDMECPHCSVMFNNGTVEKVLREYEDEVKLAVKHYPLGIFPMSQTYALAAECVGQRNGGRDFYEFIFELHDDGFNRAISETVGDYDEIQECIESERFANKIEQDKLDGSRYFQIHGVPTHIFVNKHTGKYKVIPGSTDYATIEDVIEYLD